MYCEVDLRALVPAEQVTQLALPATDFVLKLGSKQLLSRKLIKSAKKVCFSFFSGAIGEPI